VKSKTPPPGEGLPLVTDYAGLAQEYARHRWVHPEVLRGLLEESRIAASSRVLEVGCGTGNYIVALESAVSCQCWGIDPSEEMLAEAGERPGRVHFQVGRAEQLEFSTGFFDLVFSVDVIHHLEDIALYFQDACLVLRPGGRICTVTDSESIIRHREPLSVYFPESVDVDLARYPRLSELRDLMRDAGFTELSEHTVEFPYEARDAQAYRDRAFSSLHLIGEQDWRRGLERMDRDLRSGPIPGVSRYVLLWGTGLARSPWV
jgi:ubiquinone/menaquinone biosynthesis C-methylase UbiE